ncbi:MAG TPA: mechanosensitive ion channel family protein [Methylomirabilota bacterium]|nr:mechanosensitive ion channel family protein [Methylomirabilota bacterium]
MWQLFWPGVTFVAVTISALLFRAALVRALRQWLGPTNALHVLLHAVRFPSILWCVVVGLFVAIQTIEPGLLPRRMANQLNLVLEAAVILSATFTVAGVLGTLVAAAGERRALAGGVTGLARAAVRVVVLVIGGLILLDALGVRITPLLTALGVGGLAVALALQDTLSNLFAGVHLLADRPIRVGDYVKIADTIEGHVVDVGWRSTRVRMLQNNVVIVPNKRVAESVIVNYDMPESRMAIQLPVSVACDSDPDRVESLLLDEARRAMGEVPGLLAEPAPVARFAPGFGVSSLDFTLSCHVTGFVQQYAVLHELRKRVLRRLRAEGIEIPYPTRTVELRSKSSA